MQVYAFIRFFLVPTSVLIKSRPDFFSEKKKDGKDPSF